MVVCGGRGGCFGEILGTRIILVGSSRRIVWDLRFYVDGLLVCVVVIKE